MGLLFDVTAGMAVIFLAIFDPRELPGSDMS
jgi:hypothetical protein